MNGNRHSPDRYFAFAAPEPVEADERYLTVSDKTSLRLIEFRPSTDDSGPQKPWLFFLPGWLSQKAINRNHSRTECKSSLEMSISRRVFEGDINSDCIFTWFF